MVHEQHLPERGFKMRFKIDQDLHIHSLLSSCSRDPAQTNDAILDHAVRHGLKTICLTDHYWDNAVPGASDWYAPQDFEHLQKALPLPQKDGIRFLFGCETELRKDFVLGMPVSRFRDFDFVIIPTTHLHMNDFTITREDAESIDRRAVLWVDRLDAVLEMDLPFRKIGIAHLACPLIHKGDYYSVLDRIPSSEMNRLFERAAGLGVGIELNAGDFRFEEADMEHVIRVFRIAKDCGCKFYLGSDAHHPGSFESCIGRFARAVSYLDLQESDKFLPDFRQ